MMCSLAHQAVEDDDRDASGHCGLVREGMKVSTESLTTEPRAVADRHRGDKTALDDAEIASLEWPTGAKGNAKRQAGDRRGRRPDGGDQSIAGRCRARSATFSADRADLWRALRGARHRERGFRRPFGRKPGQSRSGRRHAVLGPGLDAGQARSGLLPEHPRIAEGPWRVLVPLYRRQRYGRYRAHRQRGGGEGGLRPALHPHSQDHRQRSDGKRPRARLSIGGALRGPGVHGGRPRQSLAAGRLRRGRDGPRGRVPDRRICRRTDGRRRRSASDLSARAHLRRSQIPVRGQVGP